jgi:hypothetical protein
MRKKALYFSVPFLYNVKVVCKCILKFLKRLQAKMIRTHQPCNGNPSFNSYDSFQFLGEDLNKSIAYFLNPH